MYTGTIFKAAFLASFFSFLSISNLVPHSIATYEHMKQLARPDVIFFTSRCTFSSQMVKTLQFRDKVKVLKIPSLGSSRLCPVAAVKAMLKLYKGDKNSPLVQIKSFGKWVPLIDTRLRKFHSKCQKF